MEPPVLRWEAAATQPLPVLTQMLPPTPPVPPASSPPGEHGDGPTVRVLLAGDSEPRTCRWDPEDLTMLADLDEAVGGVSNFDVTRLWHMLVLFWVSCDARHEMTLREFGRRFPWGGDNRIANLTKGAGILWRQML